MGELDRRSLMMLSAALAAAETVSFSDPAKGASRGRRKVPDRVRRAYEARQRAADLAYALDIAPIESNGDDDRYPERWGSYTKALPHDRLGAVDGKAYLALLRALESGDDRRFEDVPLGGFTKLANPQGAYSIELVGPDGCQARCGPAPDLVSAETAAEAVELYWQAHLRDVPFSSYTQDSTAARAAAELGRLEDYRGPRAGGEVRVADLFRGSSAGDLRGPYVSQFLLLDAPMRPLRIEQRIQATMPGIDYMTDPAEWHRIVCGQLAGVNEFDPVRRYIRTGRDLAEYVHRDFSYQPFLVACLIALNQGALPDGGSPYKHSRTQSGFATFGQPFLYYKLALASQAALRACWFYKWLVHRRLRPEEYGGLVHHRLTGELEVPLHPQVLESEAVTATRERFGTALLPQAYPEGCPTHPAYPSGHASMMGACATVLKACLDENHVFPDPVVSSPDGTKLEPWKGEDLSLGDELDKLASNISIGRLFAGIHWRSDAAAGLALGEEVAIQVLRELTLTGNEDFTAWSLRKFDGQRISISS